MPVTTTQTLDLAQVLGDLLAPVEDLRVYFYVADTVRPASNGGAAVIMQPSVDYRDPAAAFCAATWTFPLLLLVPRNNDRDAQRTLSRLLQQVTSTLGDAAVPGVFSIDPVDANPTTATVSGQDLPGYAITVRVRA